MNYNYRNLQNQLSNNPNSNAWVITSVPNATDGSTGIRYNNITQLSENNVITMESNGTPVTSIEFIYQIKNFTNIDNILPISDLTDYPYCAGYIIPLTLNNEFNGNHKYDASSNIQFEQVDFLCNFHTVIKKRVSPEIIRDEVINDISNFPFRQTFNLTPNTINETFRPQPQPTTLDFSQGWNSVKLTLKDKINNVIYSSGLPNNKKQVLYFNNIIIPNNANFPEKLKNLNSFSGLVILLTKEDIDKIKLNNEDYIIPALRDSILPIEFHTTFLIYTYLGIGKVYNGDSTLRKELYNMDFRAPKDLTVAESNKPIFFSFDSSHSFGYLQMFELGENNIIVNVI